MLRHCDAMNIQVGEEALKLPKTNDLCVHRQIVINELERETDQLIFIHITTDFGNKTDLCLDAQQNICENETLS